ncbi:peptidoglycan-binding protein [Phenylobacterium sp.]|uniref:peptidoglycan-binding protein n=1 Tax=Phenylobacterium sp. TaxID=1871053 RepID=UPI0035AF8563
MTLGEWLNQVILQDDGPDEATSETFFTDRPARQPPQAQAQATAPRYEAPEHPADYVERMAGLLERLTTRIEAAETRAGQAVSGVEQSVRAALERIEAAEKAQVGVNGLVEGIAEEAKAVQASLSDRLARMEAEAAGPRSSEALRALEGAISKIAGQVYDRDAHTKELIASVEERLGKIETEGGVDAALIDEVVNRVGERLAEAEGRTADALEALRRSLAALDGRLNSVEQGGAPAVEQKLESLAERLTGSLEAARSEIAEKLKADVEERFDRIERTFDQMSEHVRDAEQRSARAIEQMGREVLNVAEALNRRVQAAETRSAEAVEKVSGEVARVAQTMDARLGKSESVHVEALEKLSAEISRITEKLSERIASGERRSAQAIDDIGEQVAKVTERINNRADQTSDDLSERIRQSEERTARLLEDARERIDQRLAEARPAAEAEAAAPPVAEYEASSFPAREEPKAFDDDPFAGFPTVGEEEEPRGAAAGFLERAFPSAAAAAPRLEAPEAPAEPEAVEIDVFERPSEVRAETVEAAPAEEAEPPAFEAPGFEAPGFEAGDLKADAEAVDGPFAAEPFPENGRGTFDPFSEVEETPQEARADDGFSADSFASEDDFSSDDDLFGASEAEGAADDMLADGQTGRGLTTREVVEQARAAARAAAQNGDSNKAHKAKGGGKSLFSGFGLSRPKRRAGGTLQTFLLVSGGAAFLGLAAGGIALMNAKPSGQAPARIAESRAIVDETATGEIPADPRASVALAPQSTAGMDDVGASPVQAGASGPDLEALYGEAVQGLEGGQAGGLDELKKAANLGYAPAQLYLGKVYEGGRFGVKKDMAEARAWTERAAEGGDRRAMHNLALYYFNGEGGPKNSTTAAQWFRRAAELGLVDSQYNLARLYEEGLGVSQNAAEAYKWFLIAARSGDEESSTSAERVKAGLSAEARVVAERAAAGFRPAAADANAMTASSGSVTTAQKALSKLGYYQGPADGESTPALRLAVAAYQRDQGMAATGTLDNTTVSRLAVFTR